MLEKLKCGTAPEKLFQTRLSVVDGRKSCRLVSVFLLQVLKTPNVGFFLKKKPVVLKEVKLCVHMCVCTCVCNLCMIILSSMYGGFRCSAYMVWVVV